MTPSASTDTTEAFKCHFTPVATLASTIDSAICSPIEPPTLSPRSTMITLMSARSPKMARRRVGISVAVSIPVKPPPATTTVLRALLSGWLASALRWFSRRTACSI
ncbi:hypothetical protein D3C77_682970 [compost metagenome]